MGYMDHINRSLVGNNNGDIINQFNWDLEFVSTPTAVYWPGDALFKSRLVTLGAMPADISIDLQTAEVGGGFSVLQTGSVDRSPFDLSMEFQDYEDQSIGYFVRDWYRKVEDPVTKFGYPKAALIMNMNVLQLTNNRVPVKRWKFYAGLPANAGTNENFGRTKEVNGKVNLTIKFEWWDDEILNK